MESASRWLVGSSSSRVDASENRSAPVRPVAVGRRRGCPAAGRAPARAVPGWLRCWRPADVSGIAVAGQELGLGVDVATHRLVPGRRVGARHPLRGHLQPPVDVDEVAGGQDPVPRQDGRGRRCADPAAGSRPPRIGSRGPPTVDPRPPGRSSASSCQPRCARPDPTRSPGPTRKLALDSSSRAPILSSTCCAVITWARMPQWCGIAQPSGRAGRARGPAGAADHVCRCESATARCSSATMSESPDSPAARAAARELFRAPPRRRCRPAHPRAAPPR